MNSINRAYHCESLAILSLNELMSLDRSPKSSLS